MIAIAILALLVLNFVEIIDEKTSQNRKSDWGLNEDTREEYNPKA